MTDKFPFGFDMAAWNDMFKAPQFDNFFKAGMPSFDLQAMQDAQQKNMEAILTANKTAMEGYKALYTRQKSLFDASLAEAKDRMSDLQGQPMTAENASKNIEILKGSFEKALADVKEITEMAQTANADAFDVIKARAEEVLKDVQAATEKLAA